MKSLSHFIFLAFAISLSLARSSAEAKEWTPRSPYNYPSSFHRLILSSSSNGVQQMLGPFCLPSLQKHLQNGDLFVSPTLEKYLMPLSRFENESVRSGTFYHYSGNSKMQFNVLTGTYDSLFAYIRKNAEPGSAGFLYVAADDKSTRRWGSYQYKFQFDPDALVYVWAGAMPGETADFSFFSSAIVNKELVNAYPDLEECSSSLILPYLAMEERGVDLIAYFGINNSTSGLSVGFQWFQVLGPWAIRSGSMKQVD